MYSWDFFKSLMPHAHLVRNVAVVGHMQHGKTTLVDNLVGVTHSFDEVRTKKRAERGGKAAGDGERYTDSRVDEQQRGLSIKAAPISLLLQAANEKHYLFNLLDTPGHTNFGDEVSASLRLADGVLLVVDCIEGVVSTTERLIRHAIGERLPILLLINQLVRYSRIRAHAFSLSLRSVPIPSFYSSCSLPSFLSSVPQDRLILELKLPPLDAYFKLRQVVEEVNTVISTASGNTHPRLSPELGSVVFGSATQNWSFSLTSFAEIYADIAARRCPPTALGRASGATFITMGAATASRARRPGRRAEDLRAVCAGAAV